MDLTNFSYCSFGALLIFESKNLKHQSLFVVPRFNRFSEADLFPRWRQTDLPFCRWKRITNLVTKQETTTQLPQLTFLNWKKNAQHMRCHAKIALIKLTEIAAKVYRRTCDCVFFSWTVCNCQELKQRNLNRSLLHQVSSLLRITFKEVFPFEKTNYRHLCGHCR